MLKSGMLVSALLVSLAAVSGCGSASDADDSQPSAQARVVGAYEARTPGPITTLLFAEGQYMLVTSECGAARAPCERAGAYEINAARDELHLTDAATGKTTSLPFAVLGTRQQTAALSSQGSLRPAGICVAGSSALGGCCVRTPSGPGCDGRQLVTPGSDPVVAPSPNSITVTCTGNCAVQITVGGQSLVASGQQLNITVPVPVR